MFGSSNSWLFTIYAFYTKQLVLSYIYVDAHISRKDHNDKATTNKSSKGSSCRSLNGESVKLVMTGTGCKDVDKVEEVVECL